MGHLLSTQTYVIMGIPEREEGGKGSEKYFLTMAENYYGAEE